MTNKDRFIDAINEYNKAVEAFTLENPEKEFNPAIKDGISTQSSRMKLTLAKSSWARALSVPPYVALEVTSGVTFIFGGPKGGSRHCASHIEHHSAFHTQTILLR